MTKLFIYTDNEVDYHKLKVYIIDAYTNHDDNILFAKNYCDGYLDALANAELINEDDWDILIKFNHSLYEKFSPISDVIKSLNK